VEERDGQQGELNAAASGEHSGDADDEADSDSDGIFNSERVQVDGTFEAGVDDVGNEGGSEQAEEPMAAREEVLFIAGVVFEVGWKDQVQREKKRIA